MCTDLLTFTLKLRKMWKTSAWRPIKGCVPRHRLKWVPYLQMRSEGSHSTPGKGEGRKRKGQGKKNRSTYSYLY